MTSGLGQYSADRVRAAFIHFITGKALGALIGVLWLICLVRALPLGDYAAYIVLTGYLEIALIATSLGVVTAVERYVPELKIAHGEEKTASFLFGAVFLRAAALAIFAVLASVASGWITQRMNIPSFAEAFWWFQIVLFAEGVSRLIDSSFDSLLKQKFAQISILFRNGLRLTVLVIVWKGMNEPIDLVFWVKLEAICSVLGLITAFALLQVQSRGRPTVHGIEFLRLNFARYIRYSIPVYGAQLLAVLGGLEAAKLVVPYVATSSEFAQFGFCAMLTLMIQRYLPTTMLMGMIRPLFVAATHKPNRKVRIDNLFSIVVKLNLFAILLLVSFSMILGDLLVEVASGERFSDAGDTLTLLLVYIAAQSIKTSHNLVMVAVEDGRGTFVSLAGGTIFFWVAVALYPTMRLEVLILLLIIAEICSTLLMRGYIRRHFISLTSPVLAILKFLLMASAGAGSLAFAERSIEYRGGPMVLAGGLVLVSVVYLSIGLLIKPFSMEERNSINRVLPFRLFHW